MASIDLGCRRYDGELRLHAVRSCEERPPNPPRHGDEVSRQQKGETEGGRKGNRADYVQL